MDIVEVANKEIKMQVVCSFQNPKLSYANAVPASKVGASAITELEKYRKRS
jgi:hypothetical protein